MESSKHLLFTSMPSDNQLPSMHQCDLAVIDLQNEVLSYQIEGGDWIDFPLAGIKGLAFGEKCYYFLGNETEQ